MSDTLNDAFAQASEQLNINLEGEDLELKEPESKESSEESVKEEPKVEETEPVKEETKEEESFTKVNPNELPEELKPIYKSLQADYTRKTQEISKNKKDFENNEKRIKELEEQLEGLQPKTNKTLTPREQLTNAIDQQIEAREVANYRDQAIKDYEQADDRLKLNSDTYDKATDLYVGQEMDAKLKEWIEAGNSEYTFNHKEVLKDVLTEWDTYVQSKNKEFLEKQSKQAKAKADELKKSNPRGSMGAGRPKKVSLDEAIELASSS